jgi:cytochrome c
MRFRGIGVASIIALALLAAPVPAATPYGLGRPARPDEVAGWNIDVAPDGAGLPPGSGDVAQGEAVFAEKCAACHGEKGAGGLADRLVGGQGSLGTAKPIKTVGSYWPYATTAFDYIRRAMPYGAPQSLSPHEVYGVVAYLLWLNNIVPRDAVLDRRSLPRIQMPNRNGFVAGLGARQAGRGRLDPSRPSP